MRQEIPEDNIVSISEPHDDILEPSPRVDVIKLTGVKEEKTGHPGSYGHLTEWILAVNDDHIVGVLEEEKKKEKRESLWVSSVLID